LHLGSDAGTSLPHANTGCDRSAAEGDEHLGWLQLNVVDEVTKRLDDRVRTQGDHFKQLL